MKTSILTPEERELTISLNEGEQKAYRQPSRKTICFTDVKARSFLARALAVFFQHHLEQRKPTACVIKSS